MMADAPDEWISETTKPKDVWISEADPVNLSDPGDANFVDRTVGSTWRAFNEGFNVGAGDRPVGMTQKDVEWFIKHGLFRKEATIDGVQSVFQAFNETVMYPAVALGDALIRFPMGAYRGLQAAGVELGLPRDVVSIPDAFMGTPHPTGIPKTFPEPAVRPTEVPRPVEPIIPGPAAEAVITGQARDVPPVIAEARDLGVIGVERPPPTVAELPYEMAAPEPRSLSAARTPEESRGSVGTPGEYNARGKEWIDKIDEPADVTAVIEKIAQDHDWFPEARSGVVSAAAREAIADAAGIHPSELNGGHLSAYFDNDGKVRAVIQALRQTARDVRDTAAVQAKTPSVENAAAFAEAQMRHQHVLEYTMGIRAESGRSLAAWKDLLKETERTKAKETIAAAEQTGAAPAGVVPVMDAVADLVADVQKPGKKVGLEGLIEKAQGLVAAADAPPTPGKPKPKMSPELSSMVDAARTVVKSISGKDGKTKLQALVDQAQAALTAEQPAPGAPRPKVPPEMTGMVDAARDVLKALGGDGKKVNLEKLIDKAQALVDKAEKKPASERAVLPPELTGMVDAAKDVLKQFSGEDAALAEFRAKLEQLADGTGKLSEVVEAARDLLRKDEKTQKKADALTEPKAPSDKGRLTAAARQLLAAAEPAAKVERAPISAEMQRLMETTRQAVGRIKTENLSPELAEFRAALAEGNTDSAVAAANRLVESEAKPAAEAGAKKPPVEHEQLMAAARSVSKAAAETVAKDKTVFESPPDIVDAIAQAKAAVTELKVGEQSILGRLIESAERQAANMTKPPPPRKVADVMPPELQSLVEAADNVTKKFGGIAKTERDAFLLARTGRTVAEQEALARSVAGLTPNQLARVLNKLEKYQNPGFWDKFFYTWINGLISGPISQARNVVGNASFVLYESALVKPIAGVIGKFHGGEKVYMGEALASTVSLITAIPEAIKAFTYAFKENIRAPIPGADIITTNPNIGMKPIGGTFGNIVGIPGRVATAFDSFFSILGYRSEIQAQAWRKAAGEGLTAADDAFWNRKADLAMNPTTAMTEAATKHAQYVSFVTKLGKSGEALQNLTNTRVGGESGPQLLKFVLPFVQVPTNIIKATGKQTPLAFLDRETRADLLGQNGAAARDTAYARIVAGSMIATYVAHQVNEDMITGYGPTDPTDRAIWLRTHEPYSIRLAGWWFSYARFGPVSDVVGMTANLVSVAPKIKEGEYTEAAGQVVSATSRLVLDEVGLQGLAQFLQAFQEPDRYMQRFLGSQTSTLMPYSSLVRQTASVLDPHVRETKTVIDGFLNAVPFARQDLIAKRDWLGEPMRNPGYQSIIRQRPVNEAAIDLEVQKLHIKPGPPEDRIGGVKLTPALYDQYQAVAGAFTKTSLEAIISTPGWYSLPDYVRETAIRRVIQTTRQTAAGAFQAAHPELIDAGIKQKMDHIMGVTHTSRPKKSPPELQRSMLRDDGSIEEDATVQRSALTNLWGRLWGGKGEDASTPIVPAQNQPNYPTSEDVAFAKEAGFYDDIYEPFTKGKVARVLKQSAEGMRLSETVDEKVSKVIESNPALAEIYAKAALVANRIPIAKVGFDPDKTNLDTLTGKDANVAGVYSPTKDRMYVNAEFAEAAVHESIHRGLKMLKKARPDLANAFLNLGTEEDVVRYLMATQAGDPEKGRGDMADAQRSNALWYIEKGPQAKPRQEAIRVITEAAQQYLSERHPRRARN